MVPPGWTGGLEALLSGCSLAPLHSLALGGINLGASGSKKVCSHFLPPNRLLRSQERRRCSALGGGGV